VFVDFENVRTVDCDVLRDGSVSLTLLIGARQTKLDVDLVEQLLDHADSVQIVRMKSSGKNALDFAVAYYLGRAALADPMGRFHIISKDKDYDPLIEHLRSQGITACRHPDFAGILSPGTSAKPPESKSAPAAAAAAPSRATTPRDRLERAVEHLRRNKTNRPKRKKTLMSHLKASCGKGTTEAEVLELIQALSDAGHLSIGEKDAVAYDL
jgi:hypothetical protein